MTDNSNSSRKAAPPGGPALEEARLRQQAIGVNLRHMFDEVVTEPVPDEFAYEEAAEICQCAVGTVKSRVSRARKALQATLERGGYARDGRAAGDAMRSILADADRLSSVRG